LTKISGCDYWRLDLGSSYGTNTNVALPTGATTNITLYWNPNNGAGCTANYVTDLTTLAIAHMNFSYVGPTYAGAWESVAAPGGVYSTAGTTSAGSISYVGVTNFSPFTLASTDLASNPLPIKLDYFTAVKANGYNTLTWKAECTDASAGFVLERSSDGMHFAGIDSVTVSNATDCSVPFTYNDYGSSGPRVYYRVKMVDVMGNATYSETRLILNDANSFELLGIKPNPVQGEAWLSISASQSDKIELVLLSIDGREIQRKTVLVPAGSTTVNLETAQLAKGMYIIRGIFSGGQTNTIPFIKQ
jgi:hypothetical protein